MLKNPVNSLHISPHTPVAQIITSHKEMFNLLKSLGLNPHNYKNETLRTLCMDKHWREEELLRWLSKEFGISPSPSKKPPVDSRAQQLRSFQYQNLDLLHEVKPEVRRIHAVHGMQYPWLKKFAAQFEDFSGILNLYLMFGQKKIMPLLGETATLKKELQDGERQTLRRGVILLQKEQQKLKTLMEAMQHGSNYFVIDQSSCISLRVMNRTMIKLLEGVSRQFEIEQEWLLPTIKSNLLKIGHFENI